MNEIDAELHKKIHKHMMKVESDSIFKSRVKTFPIVEALLGEPLSGNILDVGCGNGYASIWLAKNRKDVKVTALEASELAVKELIPKHVSYHGVDDIVEVKNGSFDDLDTKDTYDTVIAFGALHHSSCLYSTMKSISKSIVSDGLLIANEPVMPNTTKNKEYIEKYDIVQNIFDLKIRNGDRCDCFYREAEYISSAVFAGFDLVSIVDFDSSAKWGLSKVKSLLIKVGVVDFKNKVMNKLLGRKAQDLGADHDEQKYRDLTKAVKTKIFIFKKSEVPYVPHLWKGLEKN